MATIAEIRQQFPQYNDIDDASLADAMHKKFYSDMPRPEFDAKIGLGQPATFDQRFDAVGQQSAEQPSAVESALSPFTTYPETYSRMRQEAEGQISTGIDQLKSGARAAVTPPQEDIERGVNPSQGAVDLLRGLSNVAVGGAGYVASPINAVLRTFVGKPIEEATGIPKEVSEFGASLAIPIPGVGKRLPTPATAGNEALEAARKLGIQDEIPRIATTDSIPQKRIGLTISKVPWAGTPVQQSIEDASRAVGQKSSQIASNFAKGGEAAGRAESGGAIRAGITQYIGPVTEGRADKLYESVGSLVNPSVKTPITNTQQVIQRIASERGEAFLPGSPAVKRVEAAAGSDGLSYQGIKKLRTSIGEDIGGGKLLPSGLSEGELKQIYGALSDDLGSAVKNAGGPEAQKAFERANKYYSLVSARREQLVKILGTKSDETLYDTVVRYASAKGGANIDALTKARKSIPADEWNEVASTAASRLGQTIKGDVNSFNPSTFLKEYGNLTPAGKRVLFDSAGKADLRRSLDNIEKVSYQLADLGQYSNPSGTAQMGIATGLGVMGLAETLVSGGQVPWATLIGLVGIRGVATMMATPKRAKAASNWFTASLQAQKNPNTANSARLSAASANLAANLNELGLVGKMQGPIPGRAGDEQNSPVGVFDQQPNGSQ